VEFVKRMTWPAGSEVVVLSVAQPVYAMVDAGGLSYLQTTQEETGRFHEELAARIERELRDAGLTTRALVLQGDARVALVEQATIEKADLLVVGSHGRSGLTKLLMGSVANHVVTHAPCTVTVVKVPSRR
jgi:nucleotide-binding universal stress UspA family protein